MSTYHEHLEPYRHLAREIKPIIPAFKPKSTASTHRDELASYRHMAQEIHSGKGTAVQPLSWSASGTTSSTLSECSTERVLGKDRKETAQKLQVAEQLPASRQQAAASEAANAKPQQPAQSLAQLQAQLSQQEQEIQRKTDQLNKLKRELTEVEQQRSATQSQIQKLEQMNLQLQEQVSIQRSEVQNEGEVQKGTSPLQVEAQKQQTDTRPPAEILKDMASQGSFPMIVFLAVLLLIVFGIAKLAIAIGLGIRTSSIAVMKVGKVYLQEPQPSRVPVSTGVSS